jgi:hypothetical protein
MHFFWVKDGTRNNSGSVDLQRMDESTFRYLARQNTFQPVIIKISLSSHLNLFIHQCTRLNEFTPLGFSFLQE